MITLFHKSSLAPSIRIANLLKQASAHAAETATEDQASDHSHQTQLTNREPFELEMRAHFKTGEYRWQLVQYDPFKDEAGNVLRWYVTATDINDQKKTEERLRTENLVLREEIDRSSMFEEVGMLSYSMVHSERTSVNAS